MESSLQGKTVLVTREKSQAKTFSEVILKYGGQPIEVPLLEIICKKRSKEDFQHISTYEWIFFTSSNGVNCFFQLLKEHNQLELIRSCKLAVVGHKTEDALKRYGLNADFIPTVYNAETMANEFMDVYPNENKGRILLVRGNISRPTLPVEFKKHGYQVDLIEVYETVSHYQMKDRLNKQITDYHIDFITFTSPSTVHAFVAMVDYSAGYKDLVCVCIGTTTEEAARQAGFKTILVPHTFTVEGMVERMTEYVNRKGSGLDGE